MAVIELDDVEKSYGDLDVLTGLSLEVREGEIFGILGPNGVGKTTLFQTILGLLRADGGSIRIQGQDHDQGKEIKERIGYLPSDISFYGDMTARKNLAFFTDLAGTDPDLDELLELVGLLDADDRPVGEFSSGMRKRLGIAQALIKDPPIIIFDEPTTGLDPEGKRAFKELVRKINRDRDKTVVISSHVTTEIDSLCDRFAILKDGTVAACGTRDELSAMTGTEIHVRVETPDPGAAASVAEEHGLSCDQREEAIVVTAEDDIRQELLEALVEEGIEVRELELDEQTLETTYIKLTGGG